MSISVIIIAHNEEENIAKCLQSLMSQSQKPDEIILVAHNCTDNTIAIAKKFPVVISELIGEPGITKARRHGIEMAKFNKILCIDGDAHASPNWIESLSKNLDNTKTVAVCTPVLFTKNKFMSMVGPIGEALSRFSKNKTKFFWGPSFGFKNDIKKLVLKTLEEFPKIEKKLNLSFCPDDFWLALNINAVSPIVLTTEAKVWAVNRQKGFWEALTRGIKSLENMKKMQDYYHKIVPNHLN